MSRKDEIYEEMSSLLRELGEMDEDVEEEEETRPNYDLREMSDPRALSGLRERVWPFKW